MNRLHEVSAARAPPRPRFPSATVKLFLTRSMTCIKDLHDRWIEDLKAATTGKQAGSATRSLCELSSTGPAGAGLDGRAPLAGSAPYPMGLRRVHPRPREDGAGIGVLAWRPCRSSSLSDRSEDRHRANHHCELLFLTWTGR